MEGTTASIYTIRTGNRSCHKMASTALVLAGQAPSLLELSADVSVLDTDDIARVGLKLTAELFRGNLTERETKKAARVMNHAFRRLARIMMTERASASSKILRLQKRSARDRLHEMAICTQGFARLREALPFQSIRPRAVAVERLEFESSLVEVNSIADTIDIVRASAENLEIPSQPAAALQNP